jgi:hypothetical protein
MSFGGGAVNSVNSCKTYIQMWLCSQRHLKFHERFFIPNYRFIGLTASREEKAFPITV